MDSSETISPLQLSDGMPSSPILAEKTTPPANEIPDGGLTAWLQVLGSFFLFFNVWGIANTFGTFQTYYSMSMLADKTPDDISWIGTIQAFLLLFVGVITGPLFDAGYFRYLLISGTTLVVFGTMMQSICETYWELMLAQAVVVGLGSGLLFITSIAIIPSYFSTKRASAIGIAAAGSSVGGIIYPIVFHTLQPRIGFGWAVRVMGFIMLITGIIPVVVIRLRIRPTQQRKLFDLSAVTDKIWLVFVIGSFFAFMGLYVPFFYVPSYASAVAHVDNNLTFYLTCFLNAGSCFGRLAAGYIADRIGSTNTFVPVTLISSVLAYCWIAIKDEAGIITFSILYGFFSGGIVSLPPSVVATITKNPGIIGTRMGMTLAVASLGVLIGSPVAGVTLNHTRQWVGLQAFAASILLVGGFFFITTRFMITGSKWIAKA